jgi:hypothetical protein
MKKHPNFMRTVELLPKHFAFDLFRLVNRTKRNTKQKKKELLMVEAHCCKAKGIRHFYLHLIQEIRDGN